MSVYFSLLYHYSSLAELTPNLEYYISQGKYLKGVNLGRIRSAGLT